MDDYESLRNLVVLEQFKNSVPHHIAVHIEGKVKRALEDAVLADEFVLTCGNHSDWHRVVPSKFRKIVLSLLNDGAAGHLGVRKTYDRVLHHFFWPRLKRDVSAYCKVCHTCQFTSKLNQNILLSI